LAAFDLWKTTSSSHSSRRVGPWLHLYSIYLFHWSKFSYDFGNPSTRNLPPLLPIFSFNRVTTVSEVTSCPVAI
jgi:hypothetical protein